MILDSSAIVAVVFQEPGFETVLTRIAEAEDVAIGAPTAAETGIVLTSRLRRDARDMLASLLREWNVSVIPFGEDHWAAAVEAFARFGKGRHPAALNFGDCLAYAMCRLTAQPLLCTGRDFAKSDLPLA